MRNPTWIDTETPEAESGTHEQTATGEGTPPGRGAGPERRPARPRLPLSDDRSWDVQDVAYFLHISESTVRNLERDRQLPALPRIGTRITFDPKVIRAFRDGWRPSPAERLSPTRSMIPPRPAPHRQGR